MSEEYTATEIGVLFRKNGTPMPKLPLKGASQAKEMFWTETSTTLPGTFPPVAMGVFRFVGV
jgi:hypothetical protein